LILGLPLYNSEPEKFKAWGINDISKLEIEELADTPSFIFLWVGTNHLDEVNFLKN